MGLLSTSGIATLIPTLLHRSPDGEEAEDGDIKSVQPEEAHNPPRLAPLLAGLGCPVSLLLEIPALTIYWSHHNINDSKLMDSGLIISLILGLTANVSLICRYFEYRPQFSTLAAIGYLTLHDLLNLAMLLIFTIKELHGVFDSFPQTGWMLVASTLFSTICNISLILDYIRVENFRAKGSGLTSKQKTLVISFMVLLIYLGLGSLFVILAEGGTLGFIDSLYFCVCTVTTVGFGDVKPTTTFCRIFIFFYAIAGILLLALTVSTIRDTILESFQAAYRLRTQQLVDHARARRKSRHLRRFNTNGIENETEGLEMTESPPNENVTDSQPSSETKTRKWSMRSCMNGFRFEKQESPISIDTGLESTLKKSYNEFKHDLLREERKDFQTKLAVASILFACFWLGGGVVFMFTEGWTYGESLYFGYVAFLTLGYGDLTVTTSGGRAFFIAWALCGIGNMTLLLSVLAEAWAKKYKHAILKTRKRCVKKDKNGNLAPDEDAEKGTQSRQSGDERELLERNLNEVEEIPLGLIEAARGFQRHARFWMNGKTGEPPEGLSEMMKEVEDIEGIERIKERGEVIEQIVSADRRQKLFLISFARSFEILTDKANRTVEVFKEQEQQIKHLEKLVQQFRSEAGNQAQTTKNYFCQSPKESSFLEKQDCLTNQLHSPKLVELSECSTSDLREKSMGSTRSVTFRTDGTPNSETCLSMNFKGKTTIERLWKTKSLSNMERLRPPKIETSCDSVEVSSPRMYQGFEGNSNKTSFNNHPKSGNSTISLACESPLIQPMSNLNKIDSSSISSSKDQMVLDIQTSQPHVTNLSTHPSHWQSFS